MDGVCESSPAHLPTILTWRRQSMQQPLYEIQHKLSSFPSRWMVGVTILGLLTTPFVAGCNGETNPVPGKKAKPYSGISLTVRCGDRAFAAAITQAAQSWATRTGAIVTLHPADMTPGDDTDVGILPTRELGAWADRGDLARVPSALRMA